ncbi:5-histidylcysteine sulfoxide synthase [Colwellia sp. 4_MG-2023]|uniref:5-histidylcysteine sulfoxide synthase n=1 Tax=unclassified Colwellia TaxID=196834 RepID=UPI0026E23FA3|nr:MULTISPECIES: 5-histidylcysteine sulfoxide synthase [unclassified Colwellia]MDO6507159.1 5-histidylcysteine sulfoxide synthase [Colwellia sp. 5_MG-2023]MDO6555995.1 5-histidylcysteine sulfoxide synthase [Colwellia sp. 4_MG-2023]
MEIKPIKAPSLNGTDVKAKKQELKKYFRQTWTEYESLFSLINSDSAYFLRPEPLRHPLIFYYGHTASFYINKLMLGKFIATRINDRIEAICAVGVDEMSWDDLNDEHYDWPTVAEVKCYRDQVAILIENLIDDMELSLPITKNSLAWIILMGCEHERIHIETSSVIMRMLPLQYLSESEDWPTCKKSADAPENRLVSIKGRLVEFGKPKSDDSFGWDNEYGYNTLNLDDFKVSKYLVSNQEYLAFVNAGGYQNLTFWTEEGQQWLRFSKASKPYFWVEKRSETNEKLYWQRNLLNEIPLPLNWPVEVNYLEAKAFCQWKNSQVADTESQYIRLLTEAEWLCLRDKVDGDLASWEQTPGNLNREHYASSCPIDEFEHDGVFDVIGNVWQWTESTIDGFEGFEVHPLYDDFSTPTFDGKHNLIKGGSWISTGNEAQKYSRYAFRRHFFQHAGFRYVQSNNKRIPNLDANPYETDRDICQQLHAQYSLKTESFINEIFNAPIKNYSQQISDYILGAMEKHNIAADKCLDLGCSVGRSSFILAQYFNQVDSVDFSARYIRHGVSLQQGNAVRYCLENEGDIVDYYEVSLKSLGLPSHNNIHFSQGDAGNLKSGFDNYDVILAQQVLESSYNPRQFLQTAHQRIKSEGLLVIVSDYYFGEHHTAKNNWLGGVKVNGENVTGFDGLSEQLAPHFNLVAQQELTRVIQVNQRNFILKRPQLSIWQLK